MVTPRYDQSLAFLKRWLPQGPWVLTSIEPDQKAIETRTFTADAEQDMMQWLQKHGATRNIYFSVNRLLRPVNKKSELTDVASLDWLHVDIDPRVGENPEDEKARALRMLRQPPGDLPPPTVIVFSGGGYQGFWKLEKPVPINGDLATAEDAKRWNLQIEILYNADHCHNIDRIMRLPGTVNRPDAKKRKKGRVPALAELVEWHDDRVYPIEKFLKAPQVQNVTGFESSNRLVKISGNIKRFASVDDLPDTVNDRCKVVIVQGFDPNEPNRHPSRSEWLFYVCCELVRSGLEDDDIYSIITDPAFGISASVLDKGSKAEKYAIHQIEKAREHAIDPDLAAMNEQFAVIRNWGGKCRVIEEVYDPALKRYRVSRMSFEDFRNGHMHKVKIVGTGANNNPILKPLGQWWLQHEKRRQYDTLVFAPGKEVKGAYNLWRGFACDARPGDCSLFLSHVKDIICRGDQVLYDYVIGWCARAVQFPDLPGYSALVFRGGQGTGKSIFAKIIGSLFGRHYMQVTDPKHLVGSFNAHLRDCVILFGDEAFYAGDKKHESILKMLITEELITIEAKGVDAEAAPNCVHLIMASNEQWVVPAGHDDRRFLVLDVSEDRKEDHDYFSAILQQMDNGGREALLHYLLTYDLKNFNVRKVPKTTALQQQKIFSFSPEEEWWYSKLREGRLLPEHTGWHNEICTIDLTTDFQDYCRGFGVNRKGNSTRLGFALRRFVPNMGHPEQRRTPVQVRMPGGEIKTIQRPYFYKFPNLDVCRKHWDDNFGGPYQWPDTALPEQLDLPTTPRNAEPPF